MTTRPKVAVRVQHHPSRAEIIGTLLGGVAPLPCEVSSHSSDPPNPLEGYKQAISDLPKCSHVAVIQDDAIVCRNFPEHVTEIARANPDNIVVLFLARLPGATAMRARRAMTKRQSYVWMGREKFVPCVGILWPRHKAEHFLEWVKTNRLPGMQPPRSDDAAIAHWQLRCKEQVRVALPSLVEHPDCVDSIIGKRAKWGADKGRVALAFIGENDPSLYDWR